MLNETMEACEDGSNLTLNLVERVDAVSLCAAVPIKIFEDRSSLLNRWTTAIGLFHKFTESTPALKQNIPPIFSFYLELFLRIAKSLASVTL
jgi:hypothetical protein